MQTVDVLAYAAVFLATANVLEVLFLTLWAKREIRQTKETITSYTSSEKMHENAAIVAQHVGGAIAESIDTLQETIGEGIADAAQEAMVSFGARQMAESGKDANAIDSSLKQAYKTAGVNNLQDLMQSVQSGELDINKLMGDVGIAQPGQAMMNPMQLLVGLLPKKYQKMAQAFLTMQQIQPQAGGSPAPYSGGGGSNHVGNLR